SPAGASPLRIWLAALLIAASSSSTGLAQGTKEDYARADRLPGLVRDKVFGARLDPHWFAGGSRLWYRVDGPGGTKEFLVVDAKKHLRRPAFDHAKVARALGAADGKPVDATRLPFNRIEIERDGAVRFETGGKAYRYNVLADDL